MRAALAMMIVGLGLAACGGGERTVVVPQAAAAPSTTVVVPQGATVICPGGRTATFSDGAYRC
jgi:ABC-type glycerol-3-phosphate transport system substrate-binding protein